MEYSHTLRLPLCLEEAQIKQLPQSAYYISEFITTEEEEYLLDKIANAPKPRWKQLTHRRLQTWPSDLQKNTLLASPLPPWLTEPVISRLRSIPSQSGRKDHIFEESPHGAPNHVLINEYISGQGIMPHKDGPAYHPVVCTISLGSALCLELYATKGDGTRDIDSCARILQEPRSLLITTDSLYTDYMHGIADVTEDTELGPNTIANWGQLRATDHLADGRLKRETRTSLTYRDVIKVSSLARFGMFGKR